MNVQERIARKAQLRQTLLCISKEVTIAKFI